MSASIPPRAHYAVVAPEPPLFATRLRLIDARGQATVQPAIAGYGRDREANQGFRLPPVRIEVEARPYTWIEFSNVQYDPDPRKWPPAYWGAEGEKTESRSGKTVLQAVVVPDIVEGKMVPTRVYAPDGRLWRNHPDGSGLLPYWPDLASWGKEVDAESRIIASFRLDPARSVDDNRALIEGFASLSSTPGKELGAPLDPPRWFTDRLPHPQYRFRKPFTPYVQFRVRYALPWKEVAEIDPPGESYRRAFADSRHKLASEDFPWGVVTVVVHPGGWADLWTRLGDQPRKKDERVAHWAVDTTTRSRLVARLKSGERDVLGESWSGGESGFAFVPNLEGELSYETPKDSIEKKVKILLRDVAAFEVEAQDYAQPVYVVAKLPPSP